MYTYADTIQHIMQRGKLTEKKPAMRGITTMRNTSGRDNKMYFISDGFNLEDSRDNKFGSLLTLNGISQNNQSSMSSLIIPALPSVRSQTQTLQPQSSTKKKLLLGSAPNGKDGIPAEIELN